MEPLLTPQQLADVVQVSPRAIRRLMRRGLPHVRVGRVVRFDVSDVRPFLAARKGYFMPKLPRNMVKRGTAYYFRQKTGGRSRWFSLGTDYDVACAQIVH